MNILLINDYYSYGGTEVQSKREIDNFTSHGDSVVFLTFDPDRPLQRDFSKEWINLVPPKGILGKIKNKLFINRKVGSIIFSLINEKKIDIIHVNNCFQFPQTIYSVTRNFPSVQTIRDYYAVCPKSTCIKRQKECGGCLNERCIFCDLSIKQRLLLLPYKRLFSKKKSSITHFVCPSKTLTKKSEENGYLVSWIPNPFDFSFSRDLLKDANREINFLFYGFITKNKGIFKLISAFSLFVLEKPNAYLSVIGKIDTKFNKEFLLALKNNKHIRYLGPKKNEDIIAYFSKVYCVVVPSLWMENYPNTVLEPMANHTLVIGTNRGGPKEMIGNSKLLFDVDNSVSIIKTLKYVCNLSNEEYRSIADKNFKMIKDNNTNEKYYQRLKLVYLDAMAEKNG